MSPPPPNIQELLKNRIVHQWTQRSSGATRLHFDDNACIQRGSYHYTERSIVLSADTEDWRGPLELPLVGLIEGEQLPFARVSNGFANERERVPSVGVTTRNSRSSWKTWTPWLLGAAGLAVGAYMLMERERHIRQVRGLTLSF